MTVMSKYEPGQFSWVDLLTTDQEGAKKFYTQLFGWEFTDEPTPQGTYTMFHIDGKSVSALFEQGEEQKKQGLPPIWNSYITVENVDQACEKAQGLGANVMVQPFDVMEAGRMCVVTDPTGAAFSLWEPKQNIGAELVNSENCWCWNELYTTDPTTCSKFYSELFGWEVQGTDMSSGEKYFSFLRGEQHAGGMIEIAKEWGNFPPCWGVYFTVTNIEETLQRVKDLDGITDMPIQEAKGVGKFSNVVDPQGGRFSLIQMEN